MTLEQELMHWKKMVKKYKFDKLTNLKQREDCVVETMHKMENQEFWFAMWDVDGLHAANRKWGHQAGDVLIKQVASDIQDIKTSWEVYRYCGDEFIALFFDKPPIDDILNATGACVHSGNYQTFSSMFADVDTMVIKKKKKLKRRREDIN